MNLKQMLRGRTDLLLSADSTKGFLRDAFCNDIPKINAMMHAYDIGIIKIVLQSFPVDSIARSKAINILVKQHSMLKKTATWAIDQWIGLLDQDMLSELQTARETKRQDKISHSPLKKEQSNRWTDHADSLDTGSSFIIQNGILTAYAGQDVHVEIPAHVTEIGRGVFSENNTVVSVVIPDSVRKIGKMAFFKCENLENVAGGRNVTIIDDMAFYDCSKLTQFSFSKGLEVIGECAFLGNSLLEIRLPESIREIKDEAFRGSCKIQELRLSNPNLETLGSGVFFNCIALKKISIHAGRKVGATCFGLCDNLKDVELSDGIQVIEHGAFRDCMNLRELSLPKSVETIKSYAFYNCAMLSKIEIPCRVSEIKRMTFFNCGELKDITLPDGIIRIKYGAFSMCGFTRFNIPSSVKTIEEFAFLCCKHLKEVRFESRVTSRLSHIGTGAFCGCFSLRKFDIPSLITTIESKTFAACLALEDVTFPENLKSIGSFAFAFCKSLKKILFPPNLVSIESLAFYATDLQGITIPKSVRKIEQLAFCAEEVSYILNEKAGQFFLGEEEKRDFSHLKSEWKVLRIESDSLKIERLAIFSSALCNQWGRLWAQNYTITDAINKLKEDGICDISYSGSNPKLISSIITGRPFDNSGLAEEQK